MDNFFTRFKVARGGELEKLDADQGGRLVLEKGDDLKDLRRVLKAAAASLNRCVRFYAESSRRSYGEDACSPGPAPNRTSGTR